MLSSSLNLSWCAAFEHLDGKLHRIHVIGPVFTSEPPLSEISNVLKSSRITDHWKPKFIAILQRVPVTSTSSLLQQLLMLHYCITNEKLLVSDIVFQHNKAPLSNEGSTVGRDRMNVYRAEQAMLRMVREGDLQYEEALGAVAMVSTGAHIMEGSALSKAKVSQIILLLCVPALQSKADFLRKLHTAGATPIFRMFSTARLYQRQPPSAIRCIRTSSSLSINAAPTRT